uniref:Putative secreted protein n=1 Tax=Anopheles darlingi TaxID=43151 RepID=A0A2M4DGN4_ANODA
MNTFLSSLALSVCIAEHASVHLRHVQWYLLPLPAQNVVPRFMLRTDEPVSCVCGVALEPPWRKPVRGFLPFVCGALIQASLFVYATGCGVRLFNIHPPTSQPSSQTVLYNSIVHKDETTSSSRKYDRQKSERERERRREREKGRRRPRD